MRDIQRGYRGGVGGGESLGESCECEAPDRATCGGCGNEWCERCDPAPSALCHWCHGRGYSHARLDRRTGKVPHMNRMRRREVTT